MRNPPPTRAGGATLDSNVGMQTRLICWKSAPVFLIQKLRRIISREVFYNGVMRASNRESISKLQEEVIVGVVLGDGSLEFDGFHGTRLQIKQSERYKDYVFWLYNRLKNLCNLEPKQRQDNNQWYFSTRYLEKLTAWYKLFYPAGKKTNTSEHRASVNFSTKFGDLVYGRWVFRLASKRSLCLYPKYRLFFFEGCPSIKKDASEKLRN